MQHVQQKKKKNTLRPKLPPSRVRAEQSTAGQGWYCIIGNPIVATGSLLSAKEAEEEKQGALTLHHLWMWIDLSVWIQRTSVVKYVLIIRCSKVADSKITLTLYLATYTNGVKKNNNYVESGGDWVTPLFIHSSFCDWNYLIWQLWLFFH